MAPSTLLLDVGPATGPHGARGIGRYVRGLVDSIEEGPVERRERVWALGLPGETLDHFGERAVSSGPLGWRPLDTGWLLGRVATGTAIRRAHARVLHSTDPHRPWAPGGVRRLVTVYDLIPLNEASVLRSWRLNHRLGYRWYLRQIAHADTIIAISEATSDDLIRLLGVPEDKIHVVYPVVHVAEPIPRSPASEPTFLFVGGLDIHKRPELAIEALARFRELEGEGALRFIGPSSEAQQAVVMNQARRSGVIDHIQLDGRISDAALDAAFASATALLWTSRIEGFGLPPVEAILRGVPVISVDIASARETITGAAVLVPSDAEAIASAMTEPHPPSREAQERVRTRFSRGASAESLWAVYEPLLDGN
jgi:glycosyltransferase involved in cell wall biosynthesis